MYEIKQMREDELYHHGVLGMKWGKHKASKYQAKASTARTSAAEWRSIGKYKAQKYKDLYKKDGDKEWLEIAKAKQDKYNSYAKKDLSDAKKYESKASAYMPKSKKTSTKNTNPKSKVVEPRSKKATQKPIKKSTKKQVDSTIDKVGKMAVANAMAYRRNKYVQNSVESFFNHENTTAALSSYGAYSYNKALSSMFGG